MRSVLVTGASRGIGAASATALLDDGWRVVAGVRDPEAASAALPAREDLLVVALDVAEAGAPGRAVAEAEEFAGGALDAVVNNAGYALLGAIEDVDLAEARAMFETNLFGALAVIQAALPAMREAGRGTIVNVTSIGSRITNPLLGIYHASKWALTSASEALAYEVAPFGIRVVNVEPGMVDTDFPRATRVTGALVDGGGPYAPLFAQLRAGFGAWRSGYPNSADDVAAAVRAAAADPASPSRMLVGLDADHLAAERRGHDDDEFPARLAEFLRLDWHRRTP